MTQVLTVLYFAACVLVALIGSMALTRWRPTWAAWRTSLFGALVVPCAVWISCAWLLFDAMNSPAAECGVDACGMTMAAAMIVATLNVAGLIVSWLAAYVLQRSIRR